ncbi:MAG: hypothetical protein R3B49_08255 [Phycisphaerales bacterium]
MTIRKSAIAASALLAAVGSANAGKLVYTDLEEHLQNQTVTLDGVDILVQARPRGIAFEDGGTGGAGVFGGGADTEVGLADYLQFTFSEAVDLRRLDINKLFSEASSHEGISEGIVITTDYGSYTFVASDVAEKTVLDLPDFSGNVINISAADDSGSGRWKFQGEPLFGGAITFLRLSPLPGNSVVPSLASDFTFMALNFTPIREVPTPGSAALIGLGGLVAARRRR